MFLRFNLLPVIFFLSGAISSCVSSNTDGGDFRYHASEIRLANTNDLYRFLTYNENRFPLVSAHRGGPRTGYPENALETFEQVARQQPIIIECDVARTKDGMLVLLHDETLDRTTTGSGRVADHTLSEVKKLRLKDPEGNVTAYRIPTLDEALRWGKSKVIFTIDVKRGVPYAAVVEAIRRNTAEPYSVIITYSADQAATVHQLAPDLMISASIRSDEDLLRLNESNIPDNRLVAFVGTSEPKKQVYDLLHGHGILCILGTMGNLDKQATVRGDTTYIGFIERGADILSTDRPAQAGKALSKYWKK